MMLAETAFCLLHSTQTLNFCGFLPSKVGTHFYESKDFTTVMSNARHWMTGIAFIGLTVGGLAHAQSERPIDLSPGDTRSAPWQAPVGLSALKDDPLAIGRPRLTMHLPLDAGSGSAGLNQGERSRFSWSLEAWQLNTASLAHIQCNQHTATVDSFIAQDCRFVDQPVPENAVNLVQVRGEWMPAPGLSLGVGAYHGDRSQPASGFPNSQTHAYAPWTSGLGEWTVMNGLRQVDGLDLNVSFGLSTDRLGDFLMGLQLARYRQRHSLADFGFPLDGGIAGGTTADYLNSAQLSLGWRRGSLSGELLGQYRELPFWMTAPGSSSNLNSFDLEFSWRPRNSALSIGISNVLDSSPRGDEALDPVREEAADSIFGRIPYVRYKHDL